MPTVIDVHFTALSYFIIVVITIIEMRMKSTSTIGFLSFVGSRP
jgi:hypothetical protein